MFSKHRRKSWFSSNYLIGASEPEKGCNFYSPKELYIAHDKVMKFLMTLYKRKQNIVKLMLNTDCQNFFFSYGNQLTNFCMRAAPASNGLTASSNIWLDFVTIC